METLGAAVVFAAFVLFKSYYVVWKLFIFSKYNIQLVSLNRTM